MVYAVVVSTIAVKRSKESAALGAGIDEEQSNFTKLHPGQGGVGRGVSQTDSSLLEVSV